MSDSLLKKQFKEKDVQRLRNLVQGKYGEKNGTNVGYNKKQEFYKEGDVWQADGRTWTIKQGIKQNITKLDKARKAHIMPLCCPNCGGVMNHKHDKKFYDLHGQCYNCVIELENKIKIAGDDLWEKYTNRIMNADIDGFIKDYTNYVYDQMSISNNSYVTEAGDVEKWDGNIDRTKALKALDESIKNLEKLKK
jgi:hypothetical protein